MRTRQEVYDVIPHRIFLQFLSDQLELALASDPALLAPLVAAVTDALAQCDTLSEHARSLGARLHLVALGLRLLRASYAFPALFAGIHGPGVLALRACLRRGTYRAALLWFCTRPSWCVGAVGRGCWGRWG